MLLLIIGLLNGYQITQPADTIYWCERRKISWKDFKWNKNESSGAASSNHVYIKMTKDNGKFQFKVFAIFYPKKSWTNDSSDALLEHEQIHFDIAELTARKIRKFLSGQKVTRENSEAIIKTMYTMVNFQDQTNEKFDNETYHGYIEKKQDGWKKFVRESLQELRDYEIKCE